MMSFAERLQNVILSYEQGGHPPETVQVELLRLMAEILIDVHQKLPNQAG